MFKYKFPGKPRKLVQRTLVSAYSFPISSDVNTAVENICYGLRVFEKTFGDDLSVGEFHGFTEKELDETRIKTEDFLSDVKEKFLSRGVSYVPPVKTLLPAISCAEENDTVDEREESSDEFESPASPAPNISVQDPKKYKGHLLAKKMFSRNHSKVIFRHNFKNLSKNSLLRLKHKPLAANYLTEKYCRKFNLPSRSLHSSRVIKPNKRFLDTGKNNSVDALHADDLSKNDLAPTKVIIREARLNITTESAIAGPFSVEKKVSLDKNKHRSGFIACGVCSAIRYYKHILATKRFGIYSCEPCRLFLRKMIKRSKHFSGDTLQCRAENGVGKCVIVTSIDKNDIQDDITSKTARCEACWLNLCLQRYILTNTLRKPLIRLIPENLKLMSLNFAVDMKSFYLESASGNENENLFNAKLDKRLNTNYLLKAVRSSRRNLERLDADGSIKPRKNNAKQTASDQMENIECSQKHISQDKELYLPRGPRIKHVCRSASSVLRTSLNTSNECETDDLTNSVDYENTRMSRRSNYVEKNDKHVQCVRSRLSGYNGTSSTEIEIYQGARTLQDFDNDSCDECETEEEKLISIDFWEAYDPDEIFKTGFSLISTELMNVKALCFLCGSAGIEKLLYCMACCEPYHWYCAEGPAAFREENELENARVSWVCRKCKICSTCGKGSRVGNLTSCKRCKNSYHVKCLDSKTLNKRLFKSDRPWVCPSCLKCKSCDSNNVFTHVGNIPLCNQCFKLRQKGNYCPLCQGCYQDEDYNVQMMECGTCKCWVHAKCEGISYEKYQILSFLPDSIEFVCKLCCSVPPAQWWLAVEDELKAGYYGILNGLCKTKRVGDLLKESPKKNDLCTCVKLSSDDLEGESVRKRDLHVKRLLSLEDDAIETSDASKEDVDLNVEDRCSYCRRNFRIRNEMTRRLLKVKANVRNDEYGSVWAFHQELENVLSEVKDVEDLMAKYQEILKQFFPWFDPHRVEKEDESSAAVETVSSRERKTEVRDGQQESSKKDDYDTLRRLYKGDEYCYENYQMLDVRKCNFCKELGEAKAFEGGRMIYCGRNEWVHSNCALWSSEVFEEIDGSLQNVHSAMTRGRQIRCSVCEKKGASVGCCYKNCTLTYHFVCARKANCVFLQDKTIYCQHHDLRHKNLQVLKEERDFEILRPVYVEMDRKRKKLESPSNVRLRIGSLHVESLGKIDPVLSDSAESILPVYFRCTRLFWSTNKPWKLVQYHIQIKISYWYEKNEDTEVNYTVDHSHEDVDRVVKEVVDELVTEACSKWERKGAAKRKCVCVMEEMKMETARKERQSKCLRDRNNFNENTAAAADGQWKRAAKRRTNFENSTAAKKIRENALNPTAKLNQNGGDRRDVLERIMQLDGMVDVYNDDEPVTCRQCSRTYRTTLSYERHLDMCSSDFADFMISSCESDSMSSEEEKVTYHATSNTKILSFENCVPPPPPPPPPCKLINHADVEVAAFAPKFADAFVIEHADELSTAPAAYANNIHQANEPSVYPCSAMTFEDAQLLNNGFHNTMAVLKQETVNITPQPLAIPISEHLKFGQIITGAPGPAYSIQSIAQQPTYVIQQQPTFVTVDAAHHAQPLRIQPIADTVSFQPVMPTIIGAVMQQPSVIETAPAATAYIVNAAAPNELFAQNTMLIDNQPLIYGMETMVSNTVMSSSHHQFLAQSLTGNIGSSTLYSTTTTQVFQAAKQVPQPEISQGYILVNTPVQTTVQPQASGCVQKIGNVCGMARQSPDSVRECVYVRVDEQRKNEKKTPMEVIVKPAMKQSPKRPTKVIKVSSRPVAAQTSTLSDSSRNGVKVVTCKPNLQIRTTDKAVSVKKSELIPAAQPVTVIAKSSASETANDSYTSREKLSMLERIQKPAVARRVVKPTVARIREKNIENVLSDEYERNDEAAVSVSNVTSSRVEAVRESNLTPSRVAAVHESNVTSSKVTTQTRIVEFNEVEVSVPKVRAVEAVKEVVVNEIDVNLKNGPVNDEQPLGKSTGTVSKIKLPTFCVSNVNPNSCNASMPSLEVAKKPEVSENDRIFDELLRQHKLSINNEKNLKSAKSPSKQVSSVDNCEEKTAVIDDSSSQNVILSPPKEKSLADDDLNEKILLDSEPVPKDSPDTKAKPPNTASVEIRKTQDEEKYVTKPEGVVKNGLIVKKVKYTPRLVDRQVMEKEEVMADKRPKRRPMVGKENLTNSRLSVGIRTTKTASISYEVNAEDGFSYRTDNLSDLWNKIIEAVQNSRAKFKLPLLPKNASVDVESAYGLLGLGNNASKYLLEQLPDAWKCVSYKPVFHKSSMPGKLSLAENATGCARTEPFKSTYKYDMFGWLASRHRKPPKFMMMSDSDIFNGNRRITSLNLPMAMRFRHLKETAKETVGVFRSDIHGRGLFCLRDIDAGEMVIEYAGEVIRSTLTDTRERKYTSKGIGCYMFRIDDNYVVDATMSGNAARFINHSCDPNCYSRIVDILGKKHIIIFALRKIPKGEELTYDYKFPLEEEKIHCHCLAKKCRKYLN